MKTLVACLRQSGLIAVFAAVLTVSSLGSARAQEFADAVFRVFAEFERSTSTGTSFVVNADGIFVTNFHVVFDLENGAADPQRLSIGYLDEQGRAQFAPAEVLWRDERNDLAVLRADLPIELRALPILRSEESTTGNIPVTPNDRDRVFAVGFPGVADTFSDRRGTPPEVLIATITDGIVSRVYRFSARGQTFGRPVVQHSAQINAGNSGGPLIDECNRVVAVNTLKPVATFNLDQATAQDREIFNQTPDGVFWATHSNTLLALIQTSVDNLTIDDSICDPTPVFEVPEPQNLWYWIAGGAGIVLLGILGGVVLLRSSATTSNRRVLSQLVREKLAERAANSGGAAAAPASGGERSMWKRRKAKDKDQMAAPNPAQMQSSNPMVRLAAEARARGGGSTERVDAPAAASGGEELSWSAQMAQGSAGGANPAPGAAAPAMTPPPDAMDDRNRTRPAPQAERVGGVSVPPNFAASSGGDVIQPVSQPPMGVPPGGIQHPATTPVPPPAPTADMAPPPAPEPVVEPAPPAQPAPPPMAEEAPTPMPMPKPDMNPEADRPVSRGEGFSATRPIPAPGPSPEETVLASIPAAQAEPVRIMLKGDSEVTVSSAWLDEQPDNALTIGRSRDEADLTLDSLAISRVHARLTHRDGSFWVEDAGSSNGTKVNGTKISSATKLASGDTLHFGDEKFDIELV